MYIKIVKFVFFMCLGFLLLIPSCSSTKIEGEVIAKRYEQEETQYGIVPIFVKPDKESNVMPYVGETSILAWIPMAIEDDEDFLLTVKSSELEYDIVIKVSNEVYEKTSVGDMVKLSGYKSFVEGDVMRKATIAEMVEHEFEGGFPYVRQRKNY